MVRLAIASSLCMVLLAGCGDRHRPVARGVPAESDQKSMPPHPTIDSFHSKPSDEQPAEVSGPDVDLGPVRLKAPEGWVRKRPRIEFIRAEFALPRAEGDSADGRLTVSVAGGGLKENIDRWRDQFGGKPEKESQEKLKVDGVEVTLVDFSGTYRDQRGMLAPAAGYPLGAPGYRMLGAVFEIGGQMYFIKAYGPAKTMAAHAAEFRAFVQSLKVHETADPRSHPPHGR